MTFIKTILALLLVYCSTLSAKEDACSFLEFPIKFDSQGLPIITIKLEGKNYEALLDLGSSSGLHLPSKLIEDIPNIKLTGEVQKSINILGKVTESRKFNIATLSIGCHTFSNISGVESKNFGASIGSSKTNYKPNEMIVGLNFFKDKIIKIDYKNSLLTMFSNESFNSDINKISLIPFDLEHEGIIIRMSTENKEYQMVLDTGSSSSIFSANKVGSKENLQTCNYDLGKNIECKYLASNFNILNNRFKSEIILISFDNRFKMDGLLGSDFLNQFEVTLDLKGNRIGIVNSNLNDSGETH